MTKKQSVWALCATLSTLAGCSQAAPAQRPAPKASTRVSQNITNTANDSVLLRYQMALDEISTGHYDTAADILDEGIRRYGNRPELNLLLAYVLQHDGRYADAGERAAAVATSSPVAAIWAEQLRGAPNKPTTSLAATNSRTATGAGATTASASTATRVGQSDARLVRFEHFLADLVNAERQKAGLRTLAFDDTLAETARAHSAEMRDRKYFAHESPTASLRQPLDRYLAVFHSTPLVIAENIYSAWGSPHQLGEADVRGAHTALMNSPGHRANILFPDVVKIGIGITTNAAGDMWVTQMFSKTG